MANDDGIVITSVIEEDTLFIVDWNQAKLASDLGYHVYHRAVCPIRSTDPNYRWMLGERAWRVVNMILDQHYRHEENTARRQQVA